MGLTYADIKDAAQSAGMAPDQALAIARIAQLAVQDMNSERADYRGTVFSTPSAVFVPSARTYGGIMDAYNKYKASGLKKGKILLDADIYDISSAGQPLPWDVAGLEYEGAGYYLDSTNTLAGGTVISCGNGTFDAFAGNNVDLAKFDSQGQAQPANVFARALKNMGIRKLGILNPRHGIVCGADRMAGAWYSQVDTVFVEGNKGWGIWWENPNESSVANFMCHPTSDVTAIGAGAGLFVGSTSTAEYNQGNNTYRQLFSESGHGLARGWVWRAKGGCAFNHNNVFDIQRNNSGSVVTQSAQTFAGTPDITVADASKFPVGLQVMVKHAWTDATWGNLRTMRTYVVVASNTSTNKIQISERRGGAAISTNLNSASFGTLNLQIKTFGYANIEICGDEDAVNGAGQIQASTFHAIDSEGYTTNPVFVQNADVDLRLGFVYNAVDVANASSLCARGASGNLSSATFISIDADNGSAYNLMAAGVRVDTSAVPYATLVGVIRGNDGKVGVNLAQDKWDPVRSVYVDSGYLVVNPSAPKQKMNVFTTVWDGTTPTQLNATHAGGLSYTGTANTTSKLPALNANYVGVEFELTNASTTAGVVWTVQVSAGQPFNRQAAKTSVALALGQGVTLRGDTDGAGGYFWKVLGTNGVTV